MTDTDRSSLAAEARTLPCLHLYGVAEYDAMGRMASETGEPGVECMRVGDVALMYETLPADEVAALADSARDGAAFAALAQRHDRVLRRLHELGPVLPIRLNTVSVGLGVLASGLLDAQAGLVAQLDRF